MSETPDRCSGLVTPWLIGIVLVVTVAAVVVAFVPVVECPHIGQGVDQLKKDGYGDTASRSRIVESLISDGWEKGCAICEGSGKISIVIKWTYHPVEQTH